MSAPAYSSRARVMAEQLSATGMPADAAVALAEVFEREFRREFRGGMAAIIDALDDPHNPQGKRFVDAFVARTLAEHAKQHAEKD